MKIDDIIKKVAGVEVLPAENDVSVWKGWWEGNVDGVHSYAQFNGKQRVQLRRNSLNMGKKVCEDWANLLLNEKTDVVLSADGDGDGDEAQKTLEKVFTDCRFWEKANAGVEKTFALGTGAWVVSVDNMTVEMDEDGNGRVKKDDAKVNVSFVNAEKIRAVNIEDGQITECAFVNISTRKAYISIHLKDADGTYIVHNVTAKRTSENASGDDCWAVEKSTAEDYYNFRTESKKPWFQILRPNIVNNKAVDSPFGVPIFANAIDTLKEIDIVFDSLQSEFVLGRRKIYVTAKIMRQDKDGNFCQTFNANDPVYYFLGDDMEGGSDKPPIIDSAPPLRIAEHETALQTLFNTLSYQCGFGTEHYKFNGGSIATATQVVSENSEMFRNIKKHEILIGEALRGLTESVIYAVNNFTADNIPENVGIEVKFDDSIIEDKRGEEQADLQKVRDKVMSVAEFRMKYFNEDEETAKKSADELAEEARMATFNGMFGTGGNFGGDTE